MRLFVQVMAVLVTGLVGWMGWILYTARIQHDAVVAIEKAGGSLRYDWNLRDEPLVPTPKPWWLKWLVDRLGADCFGSVVVVRINKGGSDAEMALVGKLTLIDELHAGRSSITDAGLAHLKGLTRLRLLNLGDTAITDAGLVHLKGLTSLQHLELAHTHVTDAGLVHLKGLTHLRDLDLTNTRVTDAGLSSLKALVNLKSVGLWKSDVTRDGVRDLKTALPEVRISR